MAYQLIQLAPDSYDILLDDRIIGSVVKSGSHDAPVWIAELLDDLPLEKRPLPFTMVEYPLRSFEDVRVCLAHPQVKPDPLSRLAS
jgi:hypothetical protein